MKRLTPIEILLDSVMTVVGQEWRRGIAKSAFPETDRHWLAKALGYYTSLQEAIKDGRDIKSEYNSYRSIFDYEIVLITSAYVLAAAFNIYAWEILHDENPSHVDFVGLTALWWTVMAIILRLGFRSGTKPKALLSTGTGKLWQAEVPDTARGFDESISDILSMTADDGGITPPAGTDEPNGAANPLPLEPAIPGVTELVLSRSGAALDRVKGHLISVRRFHSTLTWASFAVFAAVCGITLFQAIGGTGNLLMLVSGGATGAGLSGAFCYFAMRQARVSQVALALFESFVAELEEALIDAGGLGDFQSRAEQRRRAWEAFRIGLNDLHRLEMKKTA